MDSQRVRASFFATSAAAILLLHGTVAGATGSGQIQILTPVEYELPDTPDAGAVAGKSTADDKAGYKISVDRKCITNIADGNIPALPSLAAGTKRTVIATNGTIGVYDPSQPDCPVVKRTAAKAFFGAFSHPANEAVFHARTIYDPAKNQFIVTAIGYDFTTKIETAYLAFSKSSLGTKWFQYRTILSNGSTPFCKNSVADTFRVPTLGFIHDGDNSRLFLTGTVTTTGGVRTTSLLDFDSGPMSTGGAAAVKCFADKPFGLVPPIVQGLDMKAYFLALDMSNRTLLREYPFLIGSNLANDKFKVQEQVTIHKWGLPPSAIQPNGQKIDTGQGMFTSPTVQIGTQLWNVHTIKDGAYSRVEFISLKTSASKPSLQFTLPSSGPQANDFLFNPSLAISAEEEYAFVTMSRTIPTDSTKGRPAIVAYGGLRDTKSGWVSALASVSSEQIEKTNNGGVACNDPILPRGCFWSDYSGIQIDPTNPSRAFIVNQLIGKENEAGLNTHFDWEAGFARARYNMLP